MGETEGMPLDKVRVLDVGRFLAGPTCAQWLGDLGADVVKIENPHRGEDGRASGPPFFAGESAFFLSANRNKRSLALDLKHREGKELFLRLAREADVVVENFRPGVMDDIGIGYDAVSHENPRIIYCALSSYGANGPLASRPGFDHIIQGFSGLMSVTGFPEGEPVRAGIPVADLLTGLVGAYGVLAALIAREQTGRGQRVETSLLESMVGLMGFQAVRYLNGAGVPPPAGNHHPIDAPYGVYKAADNYIILGATGDKRWRVFCHLIGAPELLDDPRFATNGGRHDHEPVLSALINAKLAAKTATEWEALLNAAGIPCGPINPMDQAMEHPQLRHREMVVEIPHPVMGTARLLGLPVKLSVTPGGVHRHPPLFGEHTDEVLREIGISDADLDRLRAAGVIHCHTLTQGESGETDNHALSQ